VNCLTRPLQLLPCRQTASSGTCQSGGALTRSLIGTFCSVISWNNNNMSGGCVVARCCRRAFLACPPPGRTLLAPQGAYRLQRQPMRKDGTQSYWPTSRGSGIGSQGYQAQRYSTTG